MSDNEREIGPIIEINEEILKDNLELAQRNNNILHTHHIQSIDIVGSIGSGKTSILEKIAENFKDKLRLYVICGDITTTIDSDRIRAHGALTYQINTGKQCALSAYDINNVLKTKVDPNTIDLLFVENVGNLICPSDFVLGTDTRIMIVSVTEGDHVIIKHPLLVKMSSAIIINKIDLVTILGTDLQRMIDDAKSINPKIQVIPLSAKTGENFEKLITFIETHKST
jgi:hydrogenase nickel incorporation protein HypB